MNNSHMNQTKTVNMNNSKKTSVSMILGIISIILCFFLNVLIVPVALVDSFKSFDTNSIKPVTVQVHFLEPMYYEDYKEMKTTEIAELVKNKIQEKINENIR